MLDRWVGSSWEMNLKGFSRLSWLGRVWGEVRFTSKCQLTHKGGKGWERRGVQGGLQR